MQKCRDKNKLDVLERQKDSQHDWRIIVQYEVIEETMAQLNKVL